MGFFTGLFLGALLGVIGVKLFPAVIKLVYKK